MTQKIKERYYYSINFPTRKMRDQFKKQLLAYRSKCSPDMPVYMVLAELMKNTLYEKLEVNSIGVPNGDFKRLVREKFGGKGE